MKLLQNSSYAILTMFTLASSYACEVAYPAEQTRYTDITISDARVKDFFKEQNLDIALLWQQAEDTLSAEEIANCEEVIPQAILTVSSAIQDSIKSIFKNIIKEDIEKLLQHRYDHKKCYRMQCINFIQLQSNGEATEFETVDALDINQISSKNLEEFKQNLALAIAYHFSIENLKNRLFLGDRTLLNEPLCALIIQEEIEPADITLHKMYLFENHQQEACNKLLFKPADDSSNSMIKRLLIAYLSISSLLLPPYITPIGAPESDAQCYSPEIYDYMVHIPSNMLFPFRSISIDPILARIGKRLVEYHIPPSCLKLRVEPNFIRLTRELSGMFGVITCGPLDMGHYPERSPQAESGFICCNHNGCTSLPIVSCLKNIAPAEWSLENRECYTTASDILRMISDFKTNNLVQIENQKYRLSERHDYNYVI